MIKVGLTGNFYSGQDSISKIFEKNDIAVFDADLILKYLINSSERHIKLIKSKFGEESYFLGLLNLDNFNNTEKWNNLIDLLEFDIIKAYEKFRLEHQYDIFTIFKYSFLFERNINYSMDYTINCFKPKYHRKKELQSNTFLSNLVIEKILNNEMNELDKNKNSDFIIDNFNRYLSQDSNLDTVIEHRVKDIINNLNKKIPQSKATTEGNVYTSGFWD